MVKVNIQAITNMGCCVYTTITLSEDYTMNQVIKEVKRLGYKSFRILSSGMRFVNVN